MDSRWARVARGCTAAAFAVFVAAFSHLQVGGIAPSVFAIVVSLVISGMLCTMLAGRRASLWRLIVSVGVTQFLFHWLFSGLGTPVATTHQMGAMPMDAPAAAHHNTAAMWLAHAAAGVITIVALRYGGAAFWGVADTARLLFARLVSLVVPLVHTAPPRPAVVVRGVVVRDLTLLLSSMRHRGPPMGIA